MKLIQQNTLPKGTCYCDYCEDKAITSTAQIHGSQLLVMWLCKEHLAQFKKEVEAIQV